MTGEDLPGVWLDGRCRRGVSGLVRSRLKPPRTVILRSAFSNDEDFIAAVLDHATRGKVVRVYGLRISPCDVMSNGGSFIVRESDRDPIATVATVQDAIAVADRRLMPRFVFGFDGPGAA